MERSIFSRGAWLSLTSIVDASLSSLKPPANPRLLDRRLRPIDWIETAVTNELFDGSPLSPTARQFLDMGEAIMWRWEREARARILGADALPLPVLMSMAPEMLGAIAESLTPDFPCVLATQPSAASAHGAARARNTSFGSEQIAQEYQILRESIAIAVDGALDLTARQWSGIDHLIDLALCESLRAFASTQEDLRRKLAASISHDMRTPLSVVLNGAQLAERSERPELTKRLAGKIASNAERLKDMVSELLDALTFTCGGKLPLELSSFDIADLVKEVCAEYRQMNGTRVRTHTEAVRGVWCRKSMRRALENLINNAAKYGDGDAIDIVAAPRDGRLLLSVHNGGLPIAPEQQSRIFEYFTRDVAAAASIGWGLGLPFVKRVAESHGGAVSVESSAADGTTFILNMPLDCAPYV